MAITVILCDFECNLKLVGDPFNANLDVFPQLSGFLEKGGWLITTYKVGKVQ
jgi:hypothetical protein